MNIRDVMPGIFRLLGATLFGVIILSSGGNALAATAPTVQPLKLTEKLLDDKGNIVEVEVKMNGMSMPNGVSMDGKRNVYVADPVTQYINIYNSNGRLIKKFRPVNVPLGISVNEGGTQLYVSGNNANGTRTIFELNESGEVVGSLGVWTQPSDIAVALGGVYGIDTSVNVMDSSQSVIRKYADGILLNTYGPFTWRVKNETLAGTQYADTKHTLTPLGGLSVSGNRLFVTVAENIEWGNAAPTTACGTGDLSSGCYQKDGLYWYPAGDYYWVAMVDVDSGKLLKLDGVQVKEDYSDIVRTFLLRDYATAGSTSTLALYPKGLALDNKDRLYIATVQGMKVFDRGNGAQFTVSGFGNYAFNDVVFDERNSRLLATANDSVYIYGIDGGTNPVNTAPSAPSLIGPANTYASSTPTLEIANATDTEADPLTYGYEIYEGNDSTKTIKASDTGIAGGANGKTFMTVPAGFLKEDTLYRWRAQSFDGNDASHWSDESWNGQANSYVRDPSLEVEFCVNDKNDSPETPGIISPINAASVSPFGSVLAWNASKDPDCYDTVSYTVEVSGDQAFGSPSLTSLGGTSVGIAGGLVNGKVYYWRVKAVDNHGGKSDYSSGSFTYKTTVVKFESDQPNTKVYIDGNYGYLGRLVGNAPREVEGIAPGSHFVTFVKAGYEPIYKIVNVVDPLVNDGAVTVSAKAEEWVRASRIMPSSSGSELFRFTGGNSTPFVVDYNNDGLKDIVSGGKVNVYDENGKVIDVIDGRIYLYLSEKQEQADGSTKVVLVAKGALQADGSDINVGSRAVPLIVDYNNDGRKDLLVGSGDGHAYLYLNTGTDADPAFAGAGTLSLKDENGNELHSVVNNVSPIAVDYNNDGKKDLVVGSSDGTLKLYVNIGTDAAPEFDGPKTILYVGQNANSKAFFTDWNSDGKKDMVVGGGNNVYLFLNVGTDDAPDFRSISDLQQWIKEKKRERGNREFIPYLGYSQDLGDMTNGTGDAAPFVVDWDGTSARDVVVGNGAGGESVYVTGE